MYSYIIIIPYRKREAQLELYIKNVVPLFEKYLKNFKLVIVEQEEGKLFNRGKILNIGFNEYKYNALCFFNHDVDHIPNENCIKEFYCNINENVNINEANNITIDNDKFVGICVPDCNTLGTVIKFNANAFSKSNGYTNEYWGWGCEDKTLQNRAELMNINIKKNLVKDNDKLKYFSIDFVGDRNTDSTFGSKTNFEYHTYNNLSHNEKVANMLSSGLNNLEYKILERRILNDNENIELIKVSV